MEKFTTKFQQALVEAQSLALGHEHRFIEPAHVLSAMFNQKDSSVVQLLARAGADVNQIRSSLNESFERIDRISEHPGEVQISNDLNHLSNLTDKLVQQRQEQYISEKINSI